MSRSTTRKPVEKRDMTRSAPSVKSSSEALVPPPYGVAIRMYRQGLGDCFLLAFSTSSDPEERPFYVLIDCGVLKTQPGGREKLRRVMKNIHEATDGHLNVIVATHEHYDHLSGFVDDQGPFSERAGSKQFKVDELWLAWTEDPNDAAVEVVKKRKKEIQDQLSSLQSKLDAIAKKSADVPLCLRAVRGMLFGDLSANSSVEQSNNFAVDPAAANDMMKRVRENLKPRQIRYFSPGNIHSIIQDQQCRHTMYVLGPPRKRELLRGEGSQAREDALYLGSGGDWTSLLSAVHHFVGTPNRVSKETSDKNEKPGKDINQDNRELKYEEQRYPFERQYRRLLEPDPKLQPSWKWKATENSQSYKPNDATIQFFSEHYGIKPPHKSRKKARGLNETRPSRSPKEVNWRAIDFDWLFVASSIGLKLGSDTNNTSLALAFEIGEPGKGQILLFPGDAQVGNWWSWKDLEFHNGPEKVTMADLLKRTLVYKVSHHGSHNGTPKKDRDQGDWGLSLMPKDGFVALLPVDEATAKNTGGHGKKWEMPARDLYAALHEKTKGRILRSDDAGAGNSVNKNGNAFKSSVKLTTPTGSEFKEVPDLPDIQWRRAAVQDDQTSLYFDLKIQAGRESRFIRFVPQRDTTGEMT